MSGLRDLQQVMFDTLVQPLGPGDRLASRLSDGRSMREVAATFIKPNDRLSSYERLEIYARGYWFRLLDCVYDDSPALRAVLGERKFAALARAYLATYPSRSFTLRNLCSRLPQFILERPELSAPRTALAHAVARFEWAQTVAFDAEEKPRLTPDDIADRPPGRLRLALQPYLTLLALDWPIDDYVLAVKRRDALRSEASNTIERAARRQPSKRLALPSRERTFVAVHRWQLQLYYKRLDPPAFAMLEALAAGRTLTRAIAAAGPDATAEQVREWFATWAELGWFCRR